MRRMEDREMWNIIEHIRGATPGRRLEPKPPSPAHEFVVGFVVLAGFLGVMVMLLVMVGDPA